MNLSIKDLSLILILIACVSTYLTIFFFIYVQKVEKHHLDEQVDYITKNLIYDISFFIPAKNKSEIVTNLKNIKVPNLSNEYKKIEENNKKLMHNAFKVILPFLITTLFITYILSIKYNFSYKELLVKTFLCIIVVAIVKYIFIVLFSSKYIVADLNFIKYKLIETLEELEKNKIK